MSPSRLGVAGDEDYIQTDANGIGFVLPSASAAREVIWKERGVSYLQSTHSYKWDQHSDSVKKHPEMPAKSPGDRRAE